MNKLHSKLYTAKKLLLSHLEVNGKRNTFSKLDFSKSTLTALEQDGLIKFDKPLLSKKYINNYQSARKTFESIQEKKRLASLSFGGPRSSYGLEQTKKEFENYLADKYCSLGKGLYEKLQESPEIEIDHLSFQSIATKDFANDSLSFNLEFSPEKIQEFLNEKMDLFITDELELSDDQAHRFLSYEKQKEQFSIGIVKLTNTGYSANNLKIDYMQIFKKEDLLQTNFVETALAMEREGLIEVKNIIETTPANPVVITSQDVFKYPTIIQLKVLGKFSPYYEQVYKKYSPKTQESTQEALTPNNKKLKLLEKLKEEKDLMPKWKTVMDIHPPKFSSWMRECGIDDYTQLRNILDSLQEEELLISIKSVNPAM